ncbi:MAG: AAA family ATPase [Oscillochloris sp.]|nr:AAA family ATPase [Oscillochloris sp.]
MIPTTLLEDLASYVPALILRRMVADVGATMSPSVEQFPAAALFADLSGFTALTEQFSLHNPAGTEELTQILDLYFGHLVRVVTAHGGDVVKFAGDGLLALWYGAEDLALLTQRAVQCGLAVQMMMSPDVWSGFNSMRTAAPLKMRVGVGAGEVTTMHIGGIFGRWELLVTGEPIRQTGLAESQAQPGDVVIAGDAWPLVAAGCAGELLSSGAVRLVALTDYLPMRGLDLPVLQLEMADALRSYLPKAILARMDAGQMAWLAEQRRVTVLFVNLPDLRADTPLRQAQALMRAIQSMLYRFEGSISRLGTDSKGPTLVAALGLPPLAHENDAERGVRAALAIQAALADLGFSCAIGITTGQALCGSVGGDARREYTMMGSIVNRSARLMQAAAVQFARDGGTALLCDAATMQATHRALHFEPLPPIKLKGVSEPVMVYRPRMGAIAPQGQKIIPQSGALIGRHRESELILAMVSDLVQRGRGGTLLLEGDEGIGKTRLVGELQLVARSRGLLIYIGAGSPVDNAPYGAWRSIFHSLMLGDGQSDAVTWATSVLGEEMALLAPLLRAVLQIDLADTPVTAQMSGQVRADNTRDLLVRLLARATHSSPLVVTIEDAQWLDASSWALLLAVAERVERLLLVVAVRPMAATPSEYQRLAYLPDTQRMQLRGLSPEQVRDLLAQRLNVNRVPHEVWQLIAARSQGNPFFCEELIRALRDGGLIVVHGRECRVAARAGDPIQALNNIHLPSTMQGLITSRIDRLTPTQQLTLKVASVIGQNFSLSVLRAIHPVEDNPERLVDQLFTLQQSGLIQIDAFEPELVYAFKHAVAAEVAYNLMSFRQRRQLHRVLAERLESGGECVTVANAAQLAYHWRHADDLTRAMYYLALAGEQSLRAGAYREAISFLRDAIQIAEGLLDAGGVPDRVIWARWERQLGEAYHGMGQLNESRELLERAAMRLGFLTSERLRVTFPLIIREILCQIVSIIRAKINNTDRYISLPLHMLPPSSIPVVSCGVADLQDEPNTTLKPYFSEAARIYTILAQLAYYNSQILDSIYAALHSLNLAERTGASSELAGAYATAHLAAGILPPLAAFYRRRAQETARQIGHLPTYAWLAEAQGLSYLIQGDWRRARGALNFGLTIAESLGDQRRRAECRAILALGDLHQGYFSRALESCAELYMLGQASSDTQVCAWGLIGQAESMLNMGNDGRASILLDEAAGLLAENLGSTRTEEIWAYALRAKAALRSGNHHLAERLAVAAADLVGHLPPAAIYALGGYTAIAEVFLELWEGGAGRALQAKARRSCITLRRFAMIFPVARPAALIWMGRYAWARGQQTLARRYWRRALALAGHLGMPYEQGRALFALGHHDIANEHIQRLRSAAAIFQKIGAAHDLSQVQEYLI